MARGGEHLAQGVVVKMDLTVFLNFYRVFEPCFRAAVLSRAGPKQVTYKENNPFGTEHCNGGCW